MPIPSILISSSQSGHAAYFMVEYQFSIYIIEVFAKKSNFKMLPHTEYSFLNLGYYPILAIFLKSNSHVYSATDVSQWMENDNLWLPLQDWDHPTHLPHPPDTPTSHTHLPHLPATPIDTPTCYTLQPHPLVLWLMCVVDGCVRWACQVGVSGRCVR